MRLYVIDSLTNEDVSKLREYFISHQLQSSVEDIYWLSIPDTFLSEEQKNIYGEYGPYVFALELSSSSLSIELLIRSRHSLKFVSTQTVSYDLLRWLLEYIEETFLRLTIRA